MLEKSKQILITTEHHEIFVVRSCGIEFLRGFCPECKSERELLMLDSAVTLSALSTNEILALIEDKSIHATETPGGHLLICANSLRHQKTEK